MRIYIFDRDFLRKYNSDKYSSYYYYCLESIFGENEILKRLFRILTDDEVRFLNIDVVRTDKMLATCYFSDSVSRSREFIVIDESFLSYICRAKQEKGRNMSSNEIQELMEKYINARKIFEWEQELLVPKTGVRRKSKRGEVL